MVFVEVSKTGRCFNKIEYLVPLTTGITDDVHIQGSEGIIIKRYRELFVIGHVAES